MSLEAQLSRLLPLSSSDLQQILEYASTLSKEDAVEHFTNLLGETPQSIAFISSFNSRRHNSTSLSYASQALSSTSASSIDAVPKRSRAPKKKKPPLSTPAPRPIQDAAYAAHGTAYIKKDEEDYMANKSAPSSNLALQTSIRDATTASPSKAPPSAAGHLISDMPLKSSKSAPVSRTSSPKPTAKLSIAGGRAMQGASTTLTELDSAIRSLEVSTNPSLQDNERRRCDCIATRHPLLDAAPNCLNCGKVICVKEGLGPCTFCGKPLLSTDEIQGMIRELREERGREKMALDRQGHRRPEVSRTPLPFSGVREGSAGVGGGAGPTPAEQDVNSSEARARAHRDKLLTFQAQNAQRTTVRDEAADFETPDVGTGVWASPAERARRLKKQQAVLREMEWNARPEWERKRGVVSLDIVGEKVVKRMGFVEQEPKPVTEKKEELGEYDGMPYSKDGEEKDNGDHRTFSDNPLLRGLIKPVWTGGKGKNATTDDSRRKPTWRRVQDEYEDNENVILDGGVYGSTSQDD